MRAAPSGAKRIGKHMLVVKTRHGTKRFRDKPPYDEQLSGDHFQYCGYSKALRAHLIGEVSNGYFSGTLLFEDTGKTRDAGQEVQIAPKGDRYLTSSIEDGAGLADWTVYDKKGNEIWSGNGGLLRKDPDTGVEEIAAEFDDPQWSPDSVLSVTVSMICNGTEKHGKAALRKSGGNWHWVLNISCKKK